MLQVRMLPSTVLAPAITPFKPLSRRTCMVTSRWRPIPKLMINPTAYRRTIASVVAASATSASIYWVAGRWTCARRCPPPRRSCIRAVALPNLRQSPLEPPPDLNPTTAAPFTRGRARRFAARSRLRQEEKVCPRPNKIGVCRRQVRPRPKITALADATFCDQPHW